jgi:enoyl-[acyl-carrier-protein] reductase (NADH)
VNIVTPGHLERAEEVRNDRGATSIGIGNTTVKLSVGYQDVFEAASFLSSENAASITGQELVIDQGLSLYFYGQPANLGSDEGSRS